MELLQRTTALEQTERLMGRFPVVAIIGARQVGKTTLARQITASQSGPIHHFDLEDPADLGLIVGTSSRASRPSSSR